MNTGNPDQKDAATKKLDGSGAEVDYEKRFKDTQGAYTKSQQELKASQASQAELQAELRVLKELIKPAVELDEATKTELDELKYSDPEKWRTRVNQLEKDAQAAHNDKLSEASTQARQANELERRQTVLADFSTNHPDVIINDDVIKYDVPPRITSRLESGEISFEQFLDEAANYLKAPKVVGDGNKAPNQPNLGKVGGDNNPTEGAVKGDIVQTYRESVY